MSYLLPPPGEDSFTKGGDRPSAQLLLLVIPPLSTVDAPISKATLLTGQSHVRMLVNRVQFARIRKYCCRCLPLLESLENLIERLWAGQHASACSEQCDGVKTMQRRSQNEQEQVSVTGLWVAAQRAKTKQQASRRLLSRLRCRVLPFPHRHRCARLLPVFQRREGRRNWLACPRWMKKC